MTFSRVLLTILVVVSLPACGQSEVNETATDTSKPTVKAQKFKGSKLAPTQEVMNRTAALAFWEGAGKAIVTPGEACKNVYRGRPVPPACQSELDNVVAKSTFTPRECVKGDQRNGKNYSPVNPITCYGKIDTPHATADVTMLFHETDNGIGAYWGSMVAGSLVKR